MPADFVIEQGNPNQPYKRIKLMKHPKYLRIRVSVSASMLEQLLLRPGYSNELEPEYATPYEKGIQDND